MPKGFSRRFLSVIMVLLLLVSTVSVMGSSVVSASEVDKAEVSSETITPDDASKDTTPEPNAPEIEVVQDTTEDPTVVISADNTHEQADCVTAISERTQECTSQVMPTDATEPETEAAVREDKNDSVAVLEADPDTVDVVYSDYALRGTFTDWESEDALAFVSGSSTVIEAVYAIESGQYGFKVYNMATATWYGNDGTVDDECSNWGFRTGKDKCIFNVTGGVYKFTINVADTSRLGVTVERIGDIEEKTGVYLNGEFVEAQVGDTLIYTANLKADELFENIQAYVSYDETKLTLVRKNQHPTLTEREIACPGLDGVFYPDADGIAAFNATKVQGFDFKDGNVLVTLEFKVEAEGESTVDLLIQEMAIKGLDNRSYFKNSKAVVTDGFTMEETLVISNGTTDPIETANSGLHYVVTEEGNALITYYTGSVSELVIPSEIDGYTVTGIADYAFYDCTVLRSVTLPETVTSVGAYAFYCCDVLENVTLPKTVTEIGKKAFAQATALADVYYGSTQADWQKISIAEENECLTGAVIHYTEDVPATDDEPTPDPSEPSEPQDKYYTVTFADFDGKIISIQSVKEGESAKAPEAPERAGYNFTGWNADFSNVTSDLTVTANYEKIPTPPVTPQVGAIKIGVTGGTGFTISINGGAVRPQGPSYFNTKVTIGSEVTVTANSASTGTFIGWINPLNGTIVSPNYEFTFISSGNDLYRALFSAEVEGVQMVMFVNDKSGSYGKTIDMQYYSADESIEFPADPTQVGFDFAGWSMTEEEIKSAIAAGEDVTVVAQWTRQIIPVQVTVNGGTGTGSYNANSAVTAVADEAPEGQKFAYWTDSKGNIKSYSESYKFYPSEDTEITAVFVNEDVVVDYQILVGIDSIDTTTIEDKNVFYFSWYCPEEYTFVKSGILAVNKENYNAETFVAGTTDGNVYDRSPSGTNNPVGSVTWTKSAVTQGQTWMACAYVQYRDAQGNIVTVYSDVVEATK